MFAKICTLATVSLLIAVSPTWGEFDEAALKNLVSLAGGGYVSKWWKTLAPDLEGADLEHPGKALRHSQLRGRVVLVGFGASW